MAEEESHGLQESGTSSPRVYRDLRLLIRRCCSDFILVRFIFCVSNWVLQVETQARVATPLWGHFKSRRTQPTHKKLLRHHLGDVECETPIAEGVAKVQRSQKLVIVEPLEVIRMVLWLLMWVAEMVMNPQTILDFQLSSPVLFGFNLEHIVLQFGLGWEGVLKVVHQVITAKFAIEERGGHELSIEK